MTTNTAVADKSVLITGANRGLGRALVEDALGLGARRVYAAARRPVDHADARVTPLRLDVTDPADIQAAVREVDSLDILVNNAGVAVADDLSDPRSIEAHLAVNLFGTYRVTQAVLPLLTSSRGAVINVLSLAALATVPVTPAYAISKAAAFSMSQSLRALLAPQGVTVHIVLPGPVDTDMIRDWDIPKTSPEDVARAIFAGAAHGQEEIFPDPMSAAASNRWHDGVIKMLEKQNAAAVQAVSARS